MIKKFIPFLFLLTLGFLAVDALAQQAPKPSAVTGDVVSVDPAKIVLKTATGSLDVVISAATEFKKVPPENPSLKSAVASSFGDIAVGDKLLVTGVFGESKTTLPARAIYLMSSSDIAQKQAKETERWTTRGISGRVSAVNTAANQVTIDVRGLMNTTSVVISAKDTAIYKRYKRDSVKYSEAVESTIADVKPGDMLRAVGDRGADGTTFSAEEVLTGAFQTVAGTVKLIDLEKNEVTVTEAGTNKEIVVAMTTSSAIKKFPEDMAARMAGPTATGGGLRPAGGVRPGGGQPGAGGGMRPGGQPGAGGAGSPGNRGMGGARGGVDDMFERFPAIAVSDLKIGDVIAVSSTKGDDLQRVTAIKVLAGVGPFLDAARAQAAAAGQGGNRGGGGLGNFTIPGLEGFDNP